MLSEDEVMMGITQRTPQSAWAHDPWKPRPERPGEPGMDALQQEVLRRSLVDWVLMEGDQDPDTPPSLTKTQKRFRRQVHQLNRRRIWVPHGVRCDVDISGIQHRPADWHVDAEEPPLHCNLVASRESPTETNMHNDIKALMAIARDGCEQPTRITPLPLPAEFWNRWKEPLNKALTTWAWRRGMFTGWQLRSDITTFSEAVERQKPWLQPFQATREFAKAEHGAVRPRGSVGRMRVWPGGPSHRFLSGTQAKRATLLFPLPKHAKLHALKRKAAPDEERPGTTSKARPPVVPKRHPFTPPTWKYKAIPPTKAKPSAMAKPLSRPTPKAGEQQA